MIKRVVWYFMAVILLTLAIGMTLFAVAVHHYYYDGIAKALISHAQTAKKLYNRFHPYMDDYTNDNPMISILTNFDYKNAELDILNAEGQTLGSTTGFKKTGIVRIDRQVYAGKSVQKIETVPTTGEKVMSVYYPMMVNNKLYILRFITSLTMVQTILKELYLTTIGVAILIAAFVFLISLRLARSIVDPIERITTVASEMAKGQFENRVEEIYRNELGNLARTLNYMADEIVKTERLKNEFISSITHDLRTPLTGIKGWSETMLIASDFDHQILEEGLKVINNETNRLILIVEDLLDFSKIQANSIRLQNAVVRVSDLVGNVVRSFAVKAKDKGIKLTSTIKAKATVIGDHYRLEQVLTNIVDNAIKYNREGGEVAVVVTSKEDAVTIAVKDSGIGIPKEHLPNITQSFYQVAATAEKGSGLGLAIAKNIIDLHHGQLAIESEPGIGTTVSIRLPKNNHSEDPDLK